MKIGVLADDLAFDELMSLNQQTEWIRVNNFQELMSCKNVDGLINLSYNAVKENYNTTELPVFINSVNETLVDHNHASNVMRINGWRGFINRTSWELAGMLTSSHKTILDYLNIKICLLPDQIGFVSPRLIAMIINEAFFAKEQDISTEAEIDIAMKLGTNYPKGPFEWMNEIGKENVYQLLRQLSLTDKRYQPSTLLEKEVNQL